MSGCNVRPCCLQRGHFGDHLYSRRAVPQLPSWAQPPIQLGAIPRALKPIPHLQVLPAWRDEP